MTLAPDGSPVELYALLPDRGEGELIDSAPLPGASILELGCGTGRVTRQLVARGFQVTAVDESAAMLAQVRDAEVVHARIEELDLGRCFDAALLASNLLNAEPEQRRAFLRTCRRHADVVLIETLPLGWRPREGDTTVGEVTARTHVGRFEAGVAHGHVDYEARGRRWRHAFAMRVFADEAELEAAFREEGWYLERWLDRERGWFVARTPPARP
jgi:SAM-dependent methyltransferase